MSASWMKKFEASTSFNKISETIQTKSWTKSWSFSGFAASQGCIGLPCSRESYCRGGVRSELMNLSERSSQTAAIRLPFRFEVLMANLTELEHRRSVSLSSSGKQTGLTAYVLPTFLCAWCMSSHRYVYGQPDWTG